MWWTCNGRESDKQDLAYCSHGWSEQWRCNKQGICTQKVSAQHQVFFRNPRNSSCRSPLTMISGRWWDCSANETIHRRTTSSGATYLLWISLLVVGRQNKAIMERAMSYHIIHVLENSILMSGINENKKSLPIVLKMCTECLSLPGQGRTAVKVAYLALI